MQPVVCYHRIGVGMKQLFGALYILLESDFVGKPLDGNDARKSFELGFIVANKQDFHIIHFYLPSLQ